MYATAGIFKERVQTRAALVDGDAYGCQRGVEEFQGMSD